jgi:hypothetical protein
MEAGSAALRTTMKASPARIRPTFKAKAGVVFQHIYERYGRAA